MAPQAPRRSTLAKASDGIAQLVVRWPVLVILTLLALTGLFGAFAAQSTTVDAGAVDNETTEVLAELDKEFGEEQTVFQIVVDADDDIRSEAGLRASLSLTEAVYDSDAADMLADPDDSEPVVGFLDGAAVAAEQAGLDPNQLDDAAVAQFYAAAREETPAEVQRLLDALLADADPPTSGLVLVFHDTTGLDDDAIVQEQQELADVVEAVELPAGIDAESFSMELLNDQDIGAETGRLFGAALLGIMLVLGVVYWVRPAPGQRRRVARRTGADVALTLSVIVMSVVWMQGVGALLGPGFLDLIGPFSPQTDVVPVLLVGLGVDFGIHMLARYRDEVGAGHSPGDAHRRSATTIGVTLAIATVATAIGFLSNQSSPVEFIQTLGVLAAIGVASAFVITLTFLAAVRVLLDRRAARFDRLPREGMAGQSQQALPRAAARATWLADRAPKVVLATALLLTVAGGYGFTQLDARFDQTDFVPQDAPQLDTLRQLEADFGGGLEESTQVLLRGDLTSQDAADALEESLDRVEDVDNVDLVQGEPEISEDGDESVGQVDLLTDGGLSEALELSDDIAEAFQPLDQRGVEVYPASMEKAQAELTEQISDTQARSLAIALLAATSLLILYYWRTERRPLLGVVALLPAGVALSWTFGMMALTDIPLNPVTATLTALSIGIAVPFTIYVLARFLEERDADTAVAALRRTLRRTGGPLAGSAVTTTIGFGILITSNLLPFQQLGYIIVYVIVFSMVISLFVFPSLLVLWDKWDRRPRRGGDASATAGS